VRGFRKSCLNLIALDWSRCGEHENLWYASERMVGLERMVFFPTKEHFLPTSILPDRPLISFVNIRAYPHVVAVGTLTCLSAIGAPTKHTCPRLRARQTSRGLHNNQSHQPTNLYRRQAKRQSQQRHVNPRRCTLRAGFGRRKIEATPYYKPANHVAERPTAQRTKPPTHPQQNKQRANTILND
jgi:hypothetical protein